jgi:hypothetical protein
VLLPENRASPGKRKLDTSWFLRHKGGSHVSILRSAAHDHCDHYWLPLGAGIDAR